MQYILNQDEYSEMEYNKRVIEDIKKILNENFDSEKKCYNFDKDSYKMLMITLGLGSGCQANICGEHISVVEDSNDYCEMVKKIMLL